jgi:hypothetical protein
MRQQKYAFKVQIIKWWQVEIQACPCQAIPYAANVAKERISNSHTDVLLVPSLLRISCVRPC